MKKLYKLTSLLTAGVLVFGTVAPVYAESVVAEIEEEIVCVEVEDEVVSVNEDTTEQKETEETITNDVAEIVVEDITEDEVIQKEETDPDYFPNRGGGYATTDGKGNVWYYNNKTEADLEAEIDIQNDFVVVENTEEEIVVEDTIEDVVVETTEEIVVESTEETVIVSSETTSEETTEITSPEVPTETTFTITAEDKVVTKKTTTDTYFFNMYDDLLQEIETFVYSNFKNVDNFYIENKNGVEFTPDMPIQDLVVVISYKIEIEVPDEPDKDDDDFNNTGGTVKKDKCDLTLKKVILNKNGEEATEEDFEEMGLDIDDTFTFKIVLTNVETGDIYNILLDIKEEQTISGLKVGTYKIEEIDDNYFDNVGFEFSTADEDHDSLLEEKADGYYITICNCGKIEHTANIIVENEIEEHRGYEDKDEEENLFWVPKQDEGNIPSLTPDWWDYQVAMGWIDKDFASLVKKENN